MQQYGTLPHPVGTVDVPTDEMMYWLYCPVKLPGAKVPTLPGNLKQYAPLLEVIKHDSNRYNMWTPNYAYLTVKTMWAAPDTANRPGWHTDGFMTDDLNYIWYDCVPTEFFCDNRLHSLTQDHNESLKEMAEICNWKPASFYVRYPNKTLLRLDDRVMHRVETDFKPQKRTFIKVSLSKHVYALQGNSVNHELGLDWEYQHRKVERNCPVTTFNA